MTEHRRFLVTAMAALLLVGCNQAAVVESIPAETPPPAAPVAAPVEAPHVTIPVQTFMEHALEGRASEIRAALDNGMSPNLAAEEGRTALMLSAFNGHTEVMNMLLERGAEVKTRDASGRTALMYACTGPAVEPVELLLRSGGEVNAFDGGEHWTPLMFAAAEGHGDVVQLLLDNKADPTFKDADGDTAANFARRRGHQTLAGILESAEQAGSGGR